VLSDISAALGNFHPETPLHHTRIFLLHQSINSFV
jgi:hypothetical protein